MFTYRMVLEFDGGRYHGWQEQKNARSVTGELRRALLELGAEPIEIGGSGRTDHGVHALAQVAHLRLARSRDPEALRRALNGVLAKDVHVLALASAPRSFHARHDAVLRSYLYQLSRRRTAFAKPYVWWVREDLDPARLGEAAARVAGRHDFRLFCQRPEEQASTLVEVERVEVAEAGALVLVRIVASHFLWKMVRRIVGTLVEVAEGNLTVGQLDQLLRGDPLAAGSGGPADWTAPASGLFLERVIYPGEPPLRPLAAATPVAEEPRLAPAGGGRRRGGGRRGSPSRLK